jgi:hypothetical protein
MKLSFSRIDILITHPGFPPAETANVVVCWEINLIRTGMEDVSFAIERCLSPAFDPDDIEVLVSSIPGVSGQVVYTYNDVTPSLINHWRRYFYRIVATGMECGEVTSDGKTWESSPRPHELEIIDRHNWLLQYHTGMPTYSFIERTADSPPCVCVDTTTGRSEKSSCTLCLGTGRQRPFFEPILHYVDYNPPQELVQIASFGENQVKAESCWFSAYPILKPGDILYRPIQGELWRIVKKSSVGGQGVTLQQVCRISTINRSDVEYQKLPKTIPQAELLSVIRAWEETKQERLW